MMGLDVESGGASSSTVDKSALELGCAAVLQLLLVGPADSQKEQTTRTCNEWQGTDPCSLRCSAKSRRLQGWHSVKRG